MRVGSFVPEPSHRIKQVELSTCVNTGADFQANKFRDSVAVERAHCWKTFLTRVKLLSRRGGGKIEFQMNLFAPHKNFINL